MGTWPGNHTRPANASADATGEDRPSQVVALTAQVAVTPSSVCVHHGRVAGLDSGFDGGAPMEALVVVPVVFRGSNDAREIEARRLEPGDRCDQIHEAQLVASSFPPEGFADSNRTAASDNRGERSCRIPDVPPDKSGAQAERNVVLPLLERDLASATEIEIKSSSSASTIRRWAASANAVLISIPSIRQPYSRARMIAGPPLPQATSRTRAAEVSRRWDPTDRIFSGFVGF